ncbi:unnamed protein product [marine sediment metagenome]|uniref:Uncharacterized protein n=1 Tax=marine sediment metagenome TaxID=412755 RepID=X0VFQ9_9ZZZZ
MANEIYQVIASASGVSFSSAGDVTFSAASIAFQAGRKSDLWDRGTSPQPEEYTWRAKTALQATPVVGETIDFYMAQSDSAIIDGTTTSGDAAFTDEDALANMVYVGSLVVDTTTTDSVQSGGVFRMTTRYGILVMWNNTAAETLSASAGDHDFIVTPIYPQGQ